MQATRQALYLQSRFANLNSLVVAIISLAAVVSIAGTFVGAFSLLVI